MNVASLTGTELEVCLRTLSTDALRLVVGAFRAKEASVRNPAAGRPPRAVADLAQALIDGEDTTAAVGAWDAWRTVLDVDEPRTVDRVTELVALNMAAEFEDLDNGSEQP